MADSSKRDKSARDHVERFGQHVDADGPVGERLEELQLDAGEQHLRVDEAGAKIE